MAPHEMLGKAARDRVFKCPFLDAQPGIPQTQKTYLGSFIGPHREDRPTQHGLRERRTRLFDLNVLRQITFREESRSTAAEGSPLLHAAVRRYRVDSDNSPLILLLQRRLGQYQDRVDQIQLFGRHVI
jgi:hypothetical protein